MRLPPGWSPPVAQGQLGLFTARQAREAGASPDQVQRRRASGAWVQVRGDALAPRDLVTGPRHHAEAIGLTWGDAVACLGTAARLYGLPVPDEDVERAVVPRRRPSRDRVVTHRYPLDASDVVRIGGSLVTTRTRTLLDCVGRLEPAAAERLVVWAVTRELLGERDLQQALAEGPRRWGNTQRRQALDDVRAGTLSAAERRLRRIVRRSGLTGWVFDQPIRDDHGLVGRADALFVAERLVIETDGFEHHAVTQFQADRDKQNRLIAAGYTVLRFTWFDLTHRPDHVIDQIRRTLAMLRR